jgi:two-component sensor histidine kinase
MKARVQTMALVHSMLSESRMREVDLRTMLEVLMPGEHGGAIELAGPDVIIPTYQTMPLAMVIQELYTNSTKHGAMSVRGGMVYIRWELAGNPAQEPAELRLMWREINGPPIYDQPRPGLGTSLIEGFARSELQGRIELRFPRGGAAHDLVVTLGGPNSAMRAGPPDAAAPLHAGQRSS